MAPSRLDELVLYQNLLGAWPLDATEEAGFAERILDYMAKAAHEEKLRTSWTDPDEEYEAELARFATRAIETFRGDAIAGLRELRDAVAWYGALDGLSQALLRFAAPGVPDVYQGCELWNLSLVDPDNRRPVDYELRARLLEQLAIDAPPSAEIARDALRRGATAASSCSSLLARCTCAAAARGLRDRRVSAALGDRRTGAPRHRVRAALRRPVGRRHRATAAVGTRRGRRGAARGRGVERDGAGAAGGRAGGVQERPHG